MLLPSVIALACQFNPFHTLGAVKVMPFIESPSFYYFYWLNRLIYFLMQLLDIKELSENAARICLVDQDTPAERFDLSASHLEYLRAFSKQTEESGAPRICAIHEYPRWSLFIFPEQQVSGSRQRESFRLDGVEIRKWAVANRQEELVMEDCTGHQDRLTDTAEGLMLSTYQFLPYFSEPQKKRYSLQRMALAGADADRVKMLRVSTEAVFRARDLINEPVSTLTAPKLAEEIERMSRSAGLTVEIMDQARIESLKMGGLLAVNRGSIDPPRFCVVEYHPEKAVNEKPLVLVGKGIVYDTGGLSIKPTPNSMDYMKSDMSGAAAVAAALYAISAMGLPVRVIGLIPATDNRVDAAAYVPGDVIRMHNGNFVEVLNTDAEGRLILADALSYARKYDPDLVIDLATLTGAAAAAVGTIGTVVMGTAGQPAMQNLKEAGEQCYERTVEFPLWEEYGKLLESSVADIKNIGGREAGAITAGKFLEKFTAYPWIHMDIAGPSFLFSEDGYRSQGGTGTGVRLLIEFVRKHYLNQ